jgi:hypothetical protein
LKLFAGGNRVLQKVGSLFTVFGAATIVCVVGTSEFLDIFRLVKFLTVQVFISYVRRMELGPCKSLLAKSQSTRSLLVVFAND